MTALPAPMAYMTRLHEVRVIVDSPFPSSVCFVTPPLSSAPDTVIVHKMCACLLNGVVSRVCMLDDGDVEMCGYKALRCSGSVLASLPQAFTCENMWISTRALKGLMLSQGACHAHPACKFLDSSRPSSLSLRKLVHNKLLERVCTHCMALTEEELDERMDILVEMARPVRHVVPYSQFITK